ncbi:hypothetical protein OG21DRAFT_1514438 [Imleria badia]|nr:hypothetical protein OG21DRAFT_1514438 [Imleria badia]
MTKPLPYMNICAVIQSSGTGKSRMAHEQAKLVYTLPINIRGTFGINVAYPPSDGSLHKYLVRVYGNAEDSKKRYVVFFHSLFSHAAKELERLYASQPRQSQGDFASIWRDHMSDPVYRQSFYAKVVESCVSASMDNDWRVSITKAQSRLSDLIETLNQRCKSTSEVKIVIYIDEAQELKNDFLYDEKHRTPLDILCSVVAEFHKHPLYCLLLSTQPSVQVLVPPGPAAASERAQVHSETLLTTVTETPFDCAPDIMISPGVLRLEDLVEITYLAKWGRPLWWSTMNKKHPSKDRPLVDAQYFVQTARMKLLRSNDIDAPLEEVSEIPLTAVVDVLLALDFDPSLEATYHRQAEMVTSHMRIAYSFPQHCEYFISGYPSEPFLAEAAAQQIHVYQKQANPGDPDVMVQILGRGFQRPWIDLGEHGEVVMRLLLMRAYMDGVQAEQTSSWNLNFSQGCNLVTFIQQLFSQEPADEILDSQPDNMVLDATFRNTFKDSVVRFTHFVEAGDTSALTTEALFAAFARGMAFICGRTQKYVDFAVPILLDKSATLQESSMSVILVQLKRRCKTRDEMSYAFYQEDIGLFPDVDDESSHRPYFILVAELGAEKQKGRAKQKGSRGKQKGKARQSTPPADVYVSQQPDSKANLHPHETHPRFIATVYGCSGTLYEAIGDNDAAYQRLLTLHDFLDDHPHQNSESRSAVMQLKPLWRYGEDSYDWVESEILNED